MISFAQCAAFAGLASNEMVLGVTPAVKHDRLLSSYLANLGRGAIAVRDMIVADLRAYLDLGAMQRAADQLIVLRRFLSSYPEARCAPHRREQVDNVRTPVSSDGRRREETVVGAQTGGGRVPKHATSRVSSSLDTRGLPAENDLDATDREEGTVYLLSRLRPLNCGFARRSRKRDAVGFFG